MGFSLKSGDFPAIVLEKHSFVNTFGKLTTREKFANCGKLNILFMDIISKESGKT